MILKLIKFVILTRFSKPYLIFLIIIAGLYIIPSAISHSNTTDTGFMSFYKYYVFGTLTFLFIMSLLTGGLAVTESDRQYLFTLPLSKKDLGIALFFMQFLGFGISVLFFYGVFLPLISIPAYLLAIDLIMLSLFLTSLTILATFMDLKNRIAYAVILSLFNFIGIFNIPLSPITAFIGTHLYDSLFLIFLSIALLTISFSKLKNIEFELIRTILRSSSTYYKEIRSFVGLKPISAIYRLHFNTLFFQGRINIAGASRYSSARIRLTKLVIFPAIFALIFLIVNVFLLKGKYITGIEIGLNIILAYIVFGLSFSTLSNERLWLSITSLPSHVYLRHLLLSKALAIFVLLSPFIIANLVMYLLGFEVALVSAIAEFAIFPSISAIYTYLYSFATPIQITDDIVPTMQFNLRQAIIVLLSYSVIALVIGAFYLQYFLIASIIVVNLAFAYILLNKSIHRNLVNRLAEKNFV